jgi:hypothetical protein
MPQFDASSAECLVYTSKDGLLSALGHDLTIRVTSFSVDVDASSLAIQARFDAGSLKVVSATHGGPSGDVTDDDKRKIEGNIVNEVLKTSSFPEIRFVSTSVTPSDGGFRVTGELTLHGQTRPLTVQSRPEGGKQVAKIEINQPDYGIKPYSAMLGALKIKPTVTVQIALPER